MSGFIGDLLLYNISMETADEKRKNTVKQAIANERLEGLKVSQESKKIADSYVVGKESAKRAAEKIRARYGAL
jgi:ATP-dependent protease Clp ATPase subunit